MRVNASQLERILDSNIFQKEFLGASGVFWSSYGLGQLYLQLDFFLAFFKGSRLRLKMFLI